MTQFGLIGSHIQYSFSPAYFSEKFEKEEIQATYQLIDLPEIALVAEVLATKQFAGMNVTIPYKNAIIPLLVNCSEEARKIGAVNCIALSNNGYIGYNTDAFGFEISLQAMLHNFPEQALVLGTGGSSAAVRFVLEKIGIPYLSVSRKSLGAISYEALTPEIIEKSHLIINCTPVGSANMMDLAPNICYDALTAEHLLYDLIYTPEKTLFLQKGEARGARIKNGLEMLHLQAEKSWEIWQPLL